MIVDRAGQTEVSETLSKDLDAAKKAYEGKYSRHPITGLV